MFDARIFCSDHLIESNESGKHSRPGWIQIRCPFCTGNPGWHGGFNLELGYYNCWRCGNHWIPEVIATLLSTSINESVKIFKKYSTDPSTSYIRKKQFDRPSQIVLPNNHGPMSSVHRSYLIRRNFDPDHLTRVWNLMSTGQTGMYKHRILAPVYFDGKIVTFQCRAISSQQNPPYLTCADKDEVIHHKDIVYGFDLAKPKKKCVIVEGITDVWRLGPGAVATFGKKYTMTQLKLISDNFKKAYIIADPDVESTAGEPIVDRMFYDLQVLGNCDITIVDLVSKDPGDLYPSTAKELMREIGF